MDEQHAYLFKLFEQIEETEMVVDSDAMKILLNEIDGYLLFHFTSEEYFIRFYQAPGYTMQKVDHEKAGERYVEYLEDFDAGKLNPLKLRWFLISWLDEHSRISDEEYAIFIRKKRNLS